jgi:glycosyltransferase involved in cell wall biosynthesis
MLSHAVAPDRTGGLERYVRELSAALVRTGADVTVLAKRVDPAMPERETASDGVEIVRHAVPSMSRRSYAAFAPFASMRPVLRELRRRPAVVHGHYVLPTVVPALLRTRYVYTFHAPMWRELLSEREGRFALARPVQGTAESAVRRLEALVTRRSAATVVLSRFMRDQLAELDQEAADRALVVPGGVALERFAPGQGPPAGDESGPSLFTARRLTPRTGVLELIEAMRIVNDAVPGARLAVAGEGALREQVEQRIRTLGLEDAVTVLGRVSDAELVARYRSADLVVMPTQRLEGFGLTTAEALACGTPVLGTPIGATPELLAPIDAQLVTRDATPAAIAEGAIGVLSDRRRLAALRGASRERVAPAMGWDAVAARYLELYRDVSSATR